MKRFRKALGIVALALVVSLSLAMPVSAWADEAESYGSPMFPVLRAHGTTVSPITSGLRSRTL